MVSAARVSTSVPTSRASSAAICASSAELGRPPAGIPRVGQWVDLDLAAVGAGDGDLDTAVGQLVVRMVSSAAQNPTGHPCCTALHANMGL